MSKEIYELRPNKLTGGDLEAQAYFLERLDQLIAGRDDQLLRMFLNRWWPSFRQGMSAHNLCKALDAGATK